MVRAYQMYRDDTKNAEFKFLHVFTRIEHCKKWADTRSALAKALSKARRARWLLQRRARFV